MVGLGHKRKGFSIMTIDEITAGLLVLLENNHYNPTTIAFYEREWKKIRAFLFNDYGDGEFDMEKGLAYLEKTYQFLTKYDNGTISQQRVQLLRVVHMLEDYRLHQVLTRRYYSHKNPIKLSDHYSSLYSDYIQYLNECTLSKATVEHYTTISKVFLDYLSQKRIESEKILDLSHCHGFINTLAGFSYKTVEMNVCGLRHFLRYLKQRNSINKNLADEIHMPAISKTAGIPSCWEGEDLKLMLSQIDRNNPIGKRDYAMILLACILGLRIGDIKNLRFSNFDWERKQLSFVQHKTHKPLTLPLPDVIGWAVIDYIKNGRPNVNETDVVFLKHMPPFEPFPESSHLSERIVFYMRKAGIRRDKNKHSGFHSLRHTAGSLLLEMNTPLPVISTVLGHSDVDITAVYLKTALQKLVECTLPPEDLQYETC